MPSPHFSIIIPTYNRAHLIPRAIESVVQQTYENWELIIIDDGSTDETREVVGAFKDQRISYHYQENQELNAARNAGIQLSEGQYICFLDDDDLFLPEHLFYLAKSMEEKNSPVAIFKAGMVQEVAGQSVQLPLYTSGAYSSPIRFIWEQTPNLLSFAFPREIFKAIRFDERFQLFEDHHFLYRALLRFPFFQVPHYGVHHIPHAQNRTQSYVQPERVANKVACIKDLFQYYGDQLSKYLPSEAEQKLIARQYLHFSKAAAKAGHFSWALSYLWQGVASRF